MKVLILCCLLTILSVHVNAGTYVQYKQQVRNGLVECLKDPENSKYSAAYNACLLQAAESFISKANIEFKLAYQKGNQYEKTNLINNRKIYMNAFSNCETFQDLSFDGFGTEATCKISTAKDYLGSLTNAGASLPNNWTIENRVDKYFIGY